MIERRLEPLSQLSPLRHYAPAMSDVIGQMTDYDGQVGVLYRMRTTGLYYLGNVNNIRPIESRDVALLRMEGQS